MADIVTMADDAAFVEEGIGPAQSPLVAVSFQRNVHRKEKYLEAEPKALGITQIGLSVFQNSCVAVLLSKGLSHGPIGIPFFISSLTLIIAGSLAVAAQNLHLPTLRACLGWQIVACGASVFNLICCFLKMDFGSSFCWYFLYDSDFSTVEETCKKIEGATSHFSAEIIVLEVALFAISATLAAYCCKVVNCCSPAPKMPVITVHAPPPVQQ
uniref:Uncharacterized protein n=1 Tax=Gasterosteus aculeatus aculeatus TaxID=481459 RepID=G3N719_GASAC|nr:uncharacterized protein LOC120823049 isoform X2 [Gasterosteus aculeatus aculeatus]